MCKGRERNGNLMPQSEEPLVLSLSRPRVSIVTWMCRQLAFSRSNSQNNPILGKLCWSPWLTVTTYKWYVLLWMSYCHPDRQTRSVWGINWHQRIIFTPQTMRCLNRCRCNEVRLRQSKCYQFYCSTDSIHISSWPVSSWYSFIPQSKIQR